MGVGLSERLAEALAGVGENFVLGLADFVVVLLFLFVGYVVAKFLSYFMKRFLEHIRMEAWLKQRGMHDALIGFSLTTILDKFLKLVTIAIFLGVAADVVQLVFLRELVTWFIGYVPLLVQGGTVLVIALLAGDYVTDHMKNSKVPFANALSVLLEIFIAYSGIVIALPLVLPNADVEILKTAFVLFVGGLVLAISLGLAIAIGLGAKDTMHDIAKTKRKDIEKLV